MKIGIGVHLEDNQIEWHAEQIGHDAQELFWERHAEFFAVVEQGRNEVGKEEANQDEDGERRRKQTRQSVNDYEEVEAAQDNRDGNQSPLHFRVVQAFSHAQGDEDKYHVGKKNEVLEDACYLERCVSLIYKFPILHEKPKKGRDCAIEKPSGYEPHCLRKK